MRQARRRLKKNKRTNQTRPHRSRSGRRITRSLQSSPKRLSFPSPKARRNGKEQKRKEPAPHYGAGAGGRMEDLVYCTVELVLYPASRTLLCTWPTPCVYARKH
ncbi:hypothetical protein BKA81DRAFT_358169 [Phyllosticta paracitricarpa]